MVSVATIGYLAAVITFYDRAATPETLGTTTPAPATLIGHDLH